MDDEIDVFDSWGKYLGRFISAGGGGTGCFFTILLVLLAFTIFLPIWLFKKGIDRWREGKKEVALAYWSALLILIGLLSFNYVHDRVQEANADTARQQAYQRTEQQAKQTEQVQQQHLQKAREAAERIPQNVSIDEVEVTRLDIKFTVTNHGEYPLNISNNCREKVVARLRLDQKWVDETCTTILGPQYGLLSPNSSARYTLGRVATYGIDIPITAICVPAWIWLMDKGKVLPEKNPPFVCKELTKPAGQQTAIPAPRATTIVKPAPVATPIVYVVQPGDTLGKIAAQYRVSIGSIARTQQYPKCRLDRGWPAIDYSDTISLSLLYPSRLGFKKDDFCQSLLTRGVFVLSIPFQLRLRDIL